MRKKNLIQTHIFILSAVFFTLAACYWQKWYEPIGDFGRELYIPWRLTQGDTLYRDIAYLFGAFPPHWNAFLFKIFGTSVMTLTVFNSVLTLIMTGLIYRILLRIFDNKAAFLSTMIFLILFVFNYSFMNRNMPYFAPYSHSYFYALFFALTIFNLLEIYLTKRKNLIVFLIGIFAGLAILSRLEIALTLLLATIPLLLMISKRPAELIKITAIFGLGITLPVYFAVNAWGKGLPWGEAFQLVIGYNPNWPALKELEFYRYVAGFSLANHNLTTTAWIISVFILFYFVMHLYLKTLSGIKTRGLSAKSLLLISLAACFFAWCGFQVAIRYYFDFFRAALLILPIYTIYCVRASSRAENKDLALIHLLRGSFSLWSLLMLWKIPLNITLAHYGLIHAMPGALTVTAILFSIIAPYLDNKYHCHRTARNMVLCFFAIICATVLIRSTLWITDKTIPIGSHSDKILALSHPEHLATGPHVKRFLRWAEHHIQPHENFLTFPEGAALNFLLRKESPTKHPSYLVAETATWGEEAMLSEILDSQPDYIVLVIRERKTYGYLIPGKNYLNKSLSWIQGHYRTEWASGYDFGEAGPGIKVMKKRSAK